MSDLKKEKKDTEKELTRTRNALLPEHLIFVELALEGVPKNEAYHRAGLHHDTECTTLANDLWNAPKIRYYRDCVKKLSSISAGLTVDEMTRRLSAMALTDVTDIIEVGEVHQPVNDEGLPYGEPMQQITIKDLSEIPAHKRAAIASVKPCKGGAEIKLHDKVKIMETLLKQLGAFTEKHEVTHSGGPIYTFVGDNGRGPESKK